MFTVLGSWYVACLDQDGCVFFVSQHPAGSLGPAHPELRQLSDIWRQVFWPFASPQEPAVGLFWDKNLDLTAATIPRGFIAFA